MTYASLYPLVRSGGLFLLIVGVAMTLGAIRFRSRNAILAAGAALAALATALTAAAVTSQLGKPTVAQIVWLAGAVSVEIALIPLVVRRAAPRGERAVTLAILGVVGLHFLPMAPAFGPLIGVLGLLCVANALLPMRFVNFPLRAVWTVDGSLKIAVGAAMWWIDVYMR